MSRFCHSCSTGCAVLSAEVCGGLLGASIEHGGFIVCLLDAPGVLSASLAGRGSLSAMVSTGTLSASMGKQAKLAASIGERANLHASVVCEIGEIPYLEIEPTYIWIIPDDLVSNDVYSNTTWNVS